MSDDSHGIVQVATNYPRALGYLESLGVERLWTFQRETIEGESSKTQLKEVGISLQDFKHCIQ